MSAHKFSSSTYGKFIFCEWCGLICGEIPLSENDRNKPCPHSRIRKEKPNPEITTLPSK